jgi:hypothetical protein
MTRPVVIEKAKPVYDEMNIIDKCTLSETVTKNYLNNLGQYRYCLIIQNI